MISPETAYTVTGTNSGGSVTASVSIQVNDVGPAMLAYTVNPLVATKGSTSTADAPTSSGGSVVSYAVARIFPRD